MPEIKRNLNTPHVLKLRLVYEVMEKLPTGEVTNWPIKDRMAGFVVEGQTYQEALDKGNELFERAMNFIKEEKEKVCEQLKPATIQ